MLRGIGSLLFWLFLTLSSIAMFPIAALIWLFTLPFDRRLRLLHLFTCFWGSIYTWLNPIWQVQVHGREKIRRGATYVMVANHQSLLDILVLFRLFAHFKWVSKVENFRIPCIGWNMTLNRYIQLKRGDRESVLRMLDGCRETLAQGSSIMMFPEGTRSPDGRLRAFKPGAFELALESHRPILPILVEGTAQALPKRGFVLRGRHPIRVTVMDPLPEESFRGASVETLTARVRGIFARALGEERQPAAAAD